MQPTPAEMEAAASFTLVAILVTAVVFAVIGRVVFWVLAWQAEPSTVSDDDDDEIMSRSDDRAPSEAVRTRTDMPADGRTEMGVPVLRPTTLDTARSLRAHGYTRDEARALLRSLGWSLGNDIWSQAAPPDDEVVTPIAGRRTRAKYHPTEPELEYQGPEVR